MIDDSVGESANIPDTFHQAFKGVLRWALVLSAEVARANGGRIPEAAIEDIVTSAWEALDGMAGAELKDGVSEILFGISSRRPSAAMMGRGR
jgi:hypothetical protein